MNIQVGKSAGIALLLAAALIAAMFAMGVFAPAGVGASVKGTPAPKATLTKDGEVVSKPGTTGVTLTVTFEITDDIDGTTRGGDVTVVVPDVIAVIAANYDTSKVKVTQDGVEVGSVNTATAQTIVIGEPTSGSGRGVVREDKTVTLTVEGLALAAGTDGFASGNVTVVQAPDTTAENAAIAIFDRTMTFTDASAKLDGTDLVVEFTARKDDDSGDNFNVVITPSSDDFTGTIAATNITFSGTNPDDDQTLAAAPTADGSGVTVSGYEATEKVTVTISGLGLAIGATGDQEVKIAEGSHFERTAIVGGESVRGAETVTGPRDDTDDVLNTALADAATKVELTGLMATEVIRGGNDIVITLPKFHIPASIAEDQIIIEEADDTPPAGAAQADIDAAVASVEYYGPPESVSVSGDKITLSVPRRVVRQNGQGTELNVIDGEYSILIKKSAGIRNPNSDSTQTITVKDRDPDDDNHEFNVKIISHISPKPTWVERGDTVTVTAKGINAAGDATVHLLNMGNFDDVAVLKDHHDDVDEIEGIMGLEDILNEMLMDGDLDGEDLAVLPALDRSLMDGGTAVLDFDTSSSIFNAQAQDATEDDDAKGTNILVVVDAGGNVTGHKRLGLQPTVTLNLAEVQRTGRMGVTVSDWYYGDLTDLRVNGIQVRLPDPDNPDDSVVWEEQSPPTASPLTVVVPRQARLGTMEVVVSGTTRVKQGSYNSIDKHVQTVDVGFFTLTITPSTAVTDQVIRIEGDGFGETTCITSILVGDERIREATTGDRTVGVRDNCVRTDTDGQLANSFHVPHNLKPNTYTVVITDALNRVGQGELTVPKPAISLDPEASQRGSTVTVEGENFPAEDVIGISYGDDPVTVATTDTVGKWRATFKIPVDATIGNEYKVEALSEKKGTGDVRTATGEQTVKLSAEATHTVPEEILMVEPATGSTGHSPEQISSGQRLRITASNLPLFTPVSLSIGGIGAAGRVVGEDDAADSAGRYERVILVPQLTPGIHTVELRVHNIGNTVVVVEFVEILDIVTRPTVDVFEDLITDGTLASVWRYRIDETGSDWDSFDPQFVGQPGINDLEFVSTRDIVWIRVTENIANFQGAPLFAGWNLRTLE